MAIDGAKPSGDAAAERSASLVDDEMLQSRRCSRCRVEFPLDSSLWFVQENEWWLCVPCRSALLGRDRLRGWQKTSPTTSEPEALTK
jgi:hypothetical protein